MRNLFLVETGRKEGVEYNSGNCINFLDAGIAVIISATFIVKSTLLMAVEIQFVVSVSSAYSALTERLKSHSMDFT